MEHVDRLGEEFAVEVATGTFGRDEIAGAIDDAAVELSVVEDGGAEEVDGDLAQRLVTGQQVGAVEVAEDPIEVFLAASGQQVSTWAGQGGAHHLAVPHRPGLQRCAEHVDAGPADARLDT